MHSSFPQALSRFEAVRLTASHSITARAASSRSARSTQVPGEPVIVQHGTIADTLDCWCQVPDGAPRRSRRRLCKWPFRVFYPCCLICPEMPSHLATPNLSSGNIRLVLRECALALRCVAGCAESGSPGRPSTAPALGRETPFLMA